VIIALSEYIQSNLVILLYNISVFPQKVINPYMPTQAG
jgi:hypothetical protein